MGVTSALVLYAVIWWMVFLMVIPVRLKTQGDLGEVEPGTHAGSPQVHNLKKKAWITCGIAFVIWAIVAGIIISGWITLDDLSFFDRALEPL
ncbi:MAG: DUF1467 family protein [Rhodobacteraceae bacterium]|nr:DUF1467 family protein [Paracoccaceae bacterium]